MHLMLQNTPVVHKSLGQFLRCHIDIFICKYPKGERMLQTTSGRSLDLKPAAEQNFTRGFAVGLHFGIHYVNCVLNTDQKLQNTHCWQNQLVKVVR